MNLNVNRAEKKRHTREKKKQRANEQRKKGENKKINKSRININVLSVIYKNVNKK